MYQNLHQHLCQHFQALRWDPRLWSIVQSYFFMFNRRLLHVVLDGKSSEYYHIKTAVPEASTLGATLFCFILMIFLIILSMLIILLFTINKIELLGTELASNWTLLIGVGCGLFIPILKTLSLFHLLTKRTLCN